MDYKTTEIYKYFLALEQYALGDLQILQKLAKEAEEIDEKKKDKNLNPENTTMSPYSFQFNFGKPKHCRATIPFTQMIFSCMDILGYVVRQGIVPGNHKQTQKNIEAFYDFVTPKPSIDDLNYLIQTFRHGLSHNYFPKLGKGISYHSKNPGTLFFNNGSDLCLNVNVLEIHLKEGFKKIKEAENLYSVMNSNFEILNNFYLTH
jgi:hypothetical protein